MPDSPEQIAAALRLRLQRAADAGIRYAYPAEAEGAEMSASEPLRVVDETPEPNAAGTETLSDVETDLGPDCQRCKLSGLGRKNVVFGVGNPNARLMFVGEAPGANEDRQGEPFVGRAGKLLTRIIEAIGLTREDVFISNILKCRPPNNRNPEPDEIAECVPFLERQVAAIQPKVIVGLGKFAGQFLANSKTPISRMRGNWYQYQGIPLMPTFHPAYVLRNPKEGRRLVWEDMLKVVDEYNKDLPEGEKRAVPKNTSGSGENAAT